MNDRKIFLIAVIFSLIFKFGLFFYAEFYVPMAKFKVDTADYLEAAQNLLAQGTFARKDSAGNLRPEIYRTPGYPFFLAFLQGIFHIPLWGIIVVQILLTVLTAFVTYQSAAIIDRRLGLLAGLVILCDPPIAIFSLVLLTESVFLFLISLFMLNFISYLKDQKPKSLVYAALHLSVATYVRPVTFWLGLVVGLYIVFTFMRFDLKKSLSHALLFILFIYAVTGLWQLRNFRVSGKMTFSNIDQISLKTHSMYRSYAHNKDPISAGLAPVGYYLNVSSRCLMSLMTRPGTLKDFQSSLLKVAGKVFAYPWVAFWLVGFLFGCIKMTGNIYYRFLFWVIAYFIVVTIVGLMWQAGSRLRIPMMPFVAILSAFGWQKIGLLFRKRSPRL